MLPVLACHLPPGSSSVRLLPAEIPDCVLSHASLRTAPAVHIGGDVRAPTQLFDPRSVTTLASSRPCWETSARAGTRRGQEPFRPDRDRRTLLVRLADRPGGSIATLKYSVIIAGAAPWQARSLRHCERANASAYRGIWAHSGACGLAGRCRRADRRGPVHLVLAPVAVHADVLGRRGECAAGPEHAARESAAAQLVGVGRVLLHHRVAAVHADRGGAGAQSLGGARGRGHDLYAARGALRAGRPGHRAGQGRPGPRADSGRRHPVAADQRHPDRPVAAGARRYLGARAGRLAGHRSCGPGNAAALARSGGGRRHPGRDGGGRRVRAAHGHRTAGPGVPCASLPRGDARGTDRAEVVRPVPGRGRRDRRARFSRAARYRGARRIPGVARLVGHGARRLVGARSDVDLLGGT